MAFCRFCGKKLEEGAVCDCAEAVAEIKEKNAAPEKNTAEGIADENTATSAETGIQNIVYAYNNQHNENTNPTQDYIKRVFKILKKPLTESKKLVQSENYVFFATVFGIQACISSLIALIFSAKEDSFAKAPIAVLLTFFVSCILNGGYIASLLGSYKLLKIKKTIKEALAMAIVRSVFITPILIIALMASLLSAKASILLILISVLASITIIAVGNDSENIIFRFRFVVRLCRRTVRVVILNRRRLHTRVGKSAFDTKRSPRTVGRRCGYVISVARRSVTCDFLIDARTAFFRVFEFFEHEGGASFGQQRDRKSVV